MTRFVRAITLCAVAAVALLVNTNTTTAAKLKVTIVKADNFPIPGVGFDGKISDEEMFQGTGTGTISYDTLTGRTEISFRGKAVNATGRTIRLTGADDLGLEDDGSSVVFASYTITARGTVTARMLFYSATMPMDLP